MDSPRVVIVGGGITALSVAWRLAEAKVPFIILERTDRIGGQIRTLRHAGYTFETGPNTSTISNPEVTEIFDYAAPTAQLELASSRSKKRLIWKGDRFHSLPSDFLSGLSTPLFSLSDKLHLLGEPFRCRGTNPDESIGAMAERRLGKTFVRYAIEPFVGGIYAGDPYLLTTRHALPKLYALEAKYGSFIRGAIAKMRERKSQREKRATKAVFSAVGGFENLIHALGEKVSAIGKIILEAYIIETQYNPGKGWEITYETVERCRETISVPHYVTTVRADQLSGVLPHDILRYLEPITKLKYAPIIELAIGFDHYCGHSTRAFGGLVPSCENRNLLGILYPSDCFSERVPHADSRLFTLFMEGTRDHDRLKELSEEEIIALALKELYTMQGIAPTETPSLIHLTRFPKAIPQYGIDSGARLERIAELEEAYSGLYLAGAIRDGIGMAQRIKQGSDIGLSIAQSERSKSNLHP